MEKLLEILITQNDADLEWFMIDASHVKVHRHAAGAKGGNQDRGAYKWGLNTKIHLAVDAHGLPLRVLITSGTTADDSQAQPFTEGIAADHLLADRAYDTAAIVDSAHQMGMQVVIPPKRNRKEQRCDDSYLYKLRHLVE